MTQNASGPGRHCLCVALQAEALPTRASSLLPPGTGAQVPSCPAGRPPACSCPSSPVSLKGIYPSKPPVLLTLSWCRLLFRPQLTQTSRETPANPLKHQMKETSLDHVAGAPGFLLDSVPMLLELSVVLGLLTHVPVSIF